MEVKASLNNLRISARKCRLVADLVRGQAVVPALDQLKFTNKAAAGPLHKLLLSAIANAENTYNLQKSNLKISEIKVDEGFTLKRWMPRAHGRATPLRKRSCHVTLALSEIVASAEVKKKEQEVAKPVKLEQLGKEEKKAKDKKTKTSKADSSVKKASASQAHEPTKTFQRKAG